MIETYQFDSVIGENGTIVLPEHMKPLSKHRVRLIVIDLEPARSEPAILLDELTRKYADINDEDDLPSDDIFRQHEQYKRKKEAELAAAFKEATKDETRRAAGAEWAHLDIEGWNE